MAPGIQKLQVQQWRTLEEMKIVPHKNAKRQEVLSRHGVEWEKGYKGYMTQ
jgi:hypothetical protein